ncbi:carboxypeptidase M32 [Roseateles sp. BYS180W]|uniref:Metal-dependent carboxypeptidase n=1 Tax=Roseateles rivi TaxID=3299028 RepID=A0ABW7FW11_9BURK
MTLNAYQTLCQRFTRHYRFNHLQEIAAWDQAAFMPPKGAEARALAMAEMGGFLHELMTAPELKALFEAAAQEPLGELEQASLREMRRHWLRTNALPQTLVEQRSLAASRCEHAWRQQRPANDWAGLVPNLREVLRLAREEARYLADATGLSRYDAMLDQYEPGMRSATVQQLFDALRGWLPDTIRAVMARQATEPAPIQPQGPFPVEAQRALGAAVMRLIGFDFEGGRLDESTHPFCGGVPEDVRMTTRYNPSEFLTGVLGIVHETGHGRYEQNLPTAWAGLPIGRARSMGLHESQSLFFEMQLAAHPAFAQLLSPLVRQHLGEQEAFEPENLSRLMRKVQPGLIRVDADEVTYPAHIILRFEIERALIEGDAEVEDIPALWDAKMQELLGLDTRGNFKDGPMQDVHWPSGGFGYFPCYTLGALYAAQWMAGVRRDVPNVDGLIACGELTPIFDWLRTRIWTQASRWETAELAQRASGEPLNPAHFRAHIERRYLQA